VICFKNHKQFLILPAMRKRLFLFIFNTILFSISNVLLAQNKAVFLSDSTQWADSVIATLSQDERILQIICSSMLKFH
jgi:hypothetical protein